MLHRERLFIVPSAVMKIASSVPHKQIYSIGTHLGKFSKKGEFKLHITALDYLAHYVQLKVWLKPEGETSFLYGHHVEKRFVLRMTEGAESNQGVVVFSCLNVPLGFGVLAKAAAALASASPESTAVLNLADCGLYVRQEKEIFGLTGTKEHLETAVEA